MESSQPWDISLRFGRDGTLKEKLLEYFPDGIPATEEDMEKYLTTESIRVQNSDGTEIEISLTMHSESKDGELDFVIQSSRQELASIENHKEELGEISFEDALTVLQDYQNTVAG